MKDQNRLVITGQVIDPLRDARTAAQRAYLAENVAYYGKVFLILGATAAAIYGAVYASREAAARNGVIPDKIGALDSSQSSYINGAISHCASILLGYINNAFASAAQFPSDHSNATYITMMNALEFACGGRSNVTIGGSTFTPTGGNTCNDVSPLADGWPSGNTGALHAMFGMLAQVTGKPMLNLDCKNAAGFGGYVVLATFMAIAAAALLLVGHYRYYYRLSSVFADRPKSSDFFSDEALRERVGSTEALVQQNAYGIA